MKKVLSVLLAAAMVMGMSVAAMADKSWASNASSDVDVNVADLKFNNTMMVVHVDDVAEKVPAGSEYKNMQPGDDLYFEIDYNNAVYTQAIDKDWSINIKGNEYVANASFVTFETGDIIPWAPAGKFPAELNNAKYVKVELVDVLDELDSQNVKFKLYIADNAKKEAVSEHISLNYSFANEVEKYVDFEWTNDADHAAKWVVKKETKGTAVFDFEDDVYFTVKMIPEEEVILNLSTAYDKAIDKEYNEYDADLSFYNFKGSKDSFSKVGELFFASSKDNKFIYEVVDGELVAVEAEWTDSYKLENTSKKFKGYVIETDELGYYVIADEELVVAEVETEVEAPVEAEKANPETGAADFVGAAVAMAVVSVAAAGALALKK